MVLRRKDVFNRKQIGVYHVTTRCVRQAFLLGTSFQSGQEYHHRKQWIEEWFQSLTEVMAIELCAYAIMDNHTHSILRNRPDWLETMDDYEVATRLARLFPGYQCLNGLPAEADPERVQEILDDPAKLARRKEQLADISIFMGRWEEAVARRANKEEDRKGRFWEGRFYCQKLLDPASILAATIYVELNPLRANVVELPEYSQFTSLTNRLRLTQLMSNTDLGFLDSISEEKKGPEKNLSTDSPSRDVSNVRMCREFLPLSTRRYLSVLDYVSRRTKDGSLHAVPDGVQQLLGRLGVVPDRWRETAIEFEKSYRLFAGSPEQLSKVAAEKNKRCLHGMATANNVYLTN